MSYEIIRPKIDNNKKNKLIELGHMIKVTTNRPSPKASINGKPTLKLRHWKTLSGSSIDLVRNYRNGQRAAKLKELGKLVRG